MVFLSLGSNISSRSLYLKKAIELLEKKIGKIISKSSVYETKSWGYNDDNYLNVAVSVETDLLPQSLLSATQLIEKELGRKSKSVYNSEGNIQYEKREIDIDILFYDDISVCAKNLTIPHPKLHERNFVLAPLNDIAPDFLHPLYKKTISELYNICEDNSEIKKYGLLF